MAVATAIDFKKEAQRLFDLFDQQKFPELQDLFAEDGQGVDEISRGWIRGRANLGGYFDQLRALGVSDIRSKLSDFVTKHWDDVALVTFVADQSYKAEGKKVTIKAPVSILYRRISGAWKIELVHAVPLPEA